MGVIILVVLLVALTAWLAGAGKSREVPPEDDVTTPIDEAELAAAEEELAEAEDTAPFDDGDDDWGPGAGGRSPLPGIL